MDPELENGLRKRTWNKKKIKESKKKWLRQCRAKSQYAVAQLAEPAMDTSVLEAAKSLSALYLLSNQSHCTKRVSTRTW